MKLITYGDNIAPGIYASKNKITCTNYKCKVYSVNCNKCEFYARNSNLIT